MYDEDEKRTVNLLSIKTVIDTVWDLLFEKEYRETIYTIYKEQIRTIYIQYIILTAIYNLSLLLYNEYIL